MEAEPYPKTASQARGARTCGRGVFSVLSAAFVRPDAIDLRIRAMSRVCQITGKRPITGNNVSHANNKTRRRFLPNLHTHRFWVESENRWVKLRVSSKGMRIIDKLGIDEALKKIRSRGERI